jgi:hypothetical protein
MNIYHEPIFDIHKIEEFYSKKDGVDIKYICTSTQDLHGTHAADIFYRETPHPDFGNRYFALYNHRPHFELPSELMINDCDQIETFEFGMIEGPRGWVYSQHRHDYRSIGICAIDGGRSYVKRSGDMNVPFKMMKIVNGKFEEI